jgi:hypothetical protein
MHNTVFSWGLVLDLIIVDKAERRQDAALGEELLPADGRKLAGAARAVRYDRRPPLSISSAPDDRQSVQKGRTMTRTMISAAAMPGISLIIRTARLDSGRSPFASFLP